MTKRRVLFFLGLVSILIALPSGIDRALADAGQKAILNRPVQSKGHSQRITLVQRKAASARAKTAGLLPGKSAPNAAATLDPGGIPHYFGPYANYANSPMPKGSVSSATVTSPGSGYSAPTIKITDVYGTGAGATASATAIGGLVTSLTIVTPGSGYTAPIITISDPTGAGAEATAVLGGTITGGIRKFIDSLPGLGSGSANNLGQYIPVAVPDTVTYPGSDYYEIELREYSEKMHTDLPPTRLRGYVQVKNGSDVAPIHYLGPQIIARRNVPVRFKFINKLPTGAGGNLFIPVDTTVMGAGMGPDGTSYTQNRATIHLHGNNTVWISDGTPHQWITPAGESTSYPKGVSVYNVPDMPNPGDGAMTFYYTNQQSARLMFYHDHAYGITRLNVYAGEAAGYLIKDQVETDMIEGTNVSGVNPNFAKVLPDLGIPLIIQDKTFVDATTIAAQDPTWNWGTGARNAGGKITQAVTGDLWFPHVYMPNQNAGDLSGMNAFGRWHYAPWFWPPATDLTYPPIANIYYDPVNAPWEPPLMPQMPNPSTPMEAFVDTPLVNGTAYPYLNVEPKTYRFRILNAANDRFLNLQLYVADTTVTTADGRTKTEVKMTPACVCGTLPKNWPQDGRDGGVPDPATVGPSFVQIGTEGGFLPAPVVLINQPVNWNYDQTNFDFGNVNQGTLILGAAERADVLVDFSAFAGKTLILYNDSPAPFPAIDARYDYYTGKPDLTDIGGTPTTLPGYGPNTRTIMQIRVGASATTPFALDLPALQYVFAKGADPKRGVFEVSQDPIILPSAVYNSAYNASFPSDPYIRIGDSSATFQTVAGGTATIPFQPKALQDEMGETYDLDYGRMSAMLGLEMPASSSGTQNFMLYPYASPPVEILKGSILATPIGSIGDGTQIWKFTHNGVDTHTIHTHLFNFQLINRVAWDNILRLPDPNELGWKETLRVNPLTDTIVALRPANPVVPFKVPNSVRPIDPTMPVGELLRTPLGGFKDPNAVGVTVTNDLVNFGWEYVYHCHLLDHEEMDMMHAVGFAYPPDAPTLPRATAAPAGDSVTLNWTDNSINETGFVVQRATDSGFTANVMTFNAGTATTYTDSTLVVGTVYFYRIYAINVVGSAIPSFPRETAYSQPSAVVSNAASALQLSRNTLNFASTIGGTTTPNQIVTARNAGGGSLAWSTAANQPWLTVTPASGAQSGRLTIGVLPSGLAAGIYTGLVTVTAPLALGSPAIVTVRLQVYALGTPAVGPFGVLDSPTPLAAVAGRADPATQFYQGGVPITGWALDKIGVSSVKIWRNPWPGESPQANGYVYIGDATFVDGSRPDVEAAYPNYPMNQRAGWGYLLLTNGLPNGGNGTYTFHAIAANFDGLTAELGATQITVDNANSVMPFGTIDTPAPGGIVFGTSYTNFGWALTPMPKQIPIDGSTIWVWVDGLPLGHPVYNNYRADIAALFPGYANSNGAVGYYQMNLSGFDDGLHTIAWSVKDNGNVVAGIGSRFFEILKSGTPASGASGELAHRSVAELSSYKSKSSLEAKIRRGYDPDQTGEGAPIPKSDGVLRVTVEETERLEIPLGPSSRTGEAMAGYQIVGGELRKLPVGSTLDKRTGTFYWQLGPGFLKDYHFVFVDESAKTKILLRVTVVPKKAVLPSKKK